MIKNQYRLLISCIVSVMLVLSGCSGDGGGSGSANQGETTVVSGKVSLSSVVGKPRLQKAPQGKPGSALYKSTVRQKAPFSDLLPKSPVGAPLGGALVYLFDASHPEWLSPVASGIAGTDGAFTMDILANAELNDDAYTNGDPIPAGKYTMQAVGFDPTTGEFSMALQSVVRDFSGVSTEGDNELVAQSSEVKPTVQTMLGLTRNTDGTQTWGGATTTLPPSAAIQVAFSVAMNRASIENGITISPAVDGFWAVSADWLTATLYLNDGASLAAGDYTVTVHGEDSADTTAVTVKNVYLNKLEETATASFTVEAGALPDSAAPSAIIVSPNSNSDVSIVTPIRVASNEILDVNGLLLAAQTTADPTLGAQPGVLYVGEDLVTTTQYKYVYEFILGEPLKLGKSYKISVSGGHDLSGNPMDELLYSFATETATEGVTPITLTEGEAGYEEAVVKADAQADVKDVFGKWARSMNDRNLAQMQSLMHGEFIMDYNIADGYGEADEDRSGYYDLDEFGSMLSNAFLFWDLCQTSMSGDVVGDITIGTAGDTADFEFLLTGTSGNPSKDCADAAPKESMYAKLVKINGNWLIAKASEGIDTREETVSAATAITLTAPAEGAAIELGYDEATQTEITETFSWEPVDGASAYVMMFVDVRDSQSGFAFVLPPTYTEIEIPPNDDLLFNGSNPVAAEASKEFGFTREFNPRPGVSIDWQIVALGTNTVQDIQGGRATSLPKDIVGASKPSRFSLAGEYQELTVGVTAGGSPVTFSEITGGYDAGTAASVDITISTPRLNATSGIINVSGNTFEHIMVPLSINATGDMMVGTATVNLSQGNNGIEVADANIHGDPNGGEGDRDGLVEWFNVKTTGGTAPVIAVTSVTGSGTALDGGSWDYYSAGADSSVTIEGTVSDTTITMLHVNLWNDKQGARGYREVPVAGGMFSVDMDLYTGENWIDIGGSGPCTGADDCNWYSANFGVETSAGIPWVPPVAITSVEYVDGLGTVLKRDDWGDGGNWEATPTDTAAATPAHSIVITGTLVNFSDPSDSTNTPRYNAGSEGGWEEDRLSVDVAGNFELTIDLFQGWNNVGINDVKGNFYNMNIITEFGKEVVRPEIVSLNGTPFADALNTNGDFVLADGVCSVTVVGTAQDGEVRASWNGSGEKTDGMWDGFWEEVITSVDTSDTPTTNDTYTVTFDVIGGTGYSWSDNFININDVAWNWMGVRVLAHANSNCAYSSPEMTVDTFTGDVALLENPLGYDMDDGAGGTVFIEDGMRLSNNPDDGMQVVTNTITINGTSNKSERNISAEMWFCGRQLNLGSTVADTVATGGVYPWTLTVPVYSGFNNLEIKDGFNWYRVEMDATSTSVAPAPLVSVSAITGGTLDTGATDPNDPCAGSQTTWTVNATGLTMLTITGHTDSANPEGRGEWHGDGASGPIDIDVNGDFSFEVPAYNGFSHVNINDAQWNNQSLQLNVANGVSRPQFVAITSHTHDVAPGSTNVTVSGTIEANPTGATAGTDFTPDWVSGWVNTCDNTGMCSWYEFSNDPNGAQWGQLPLTVSAPDSNGDVVVTFDMVTVAATTDFIEIEMRADGSNGDGSWGGHGHSIKMNFGTGCPDCNAERVWKPGAKAANSVSDSFSSTVDTRHRVFMSRVKK